MSRAHQQRGSALLTAVIFITIILLVSAALLFYASQGRQHAEQVSRAETEFSCAQSGLELAKAYFGKNTGSWNSFLAQPSKYNPIPSTWNTAPANPTTAAGLAALRASNPELFFDLDGDGKPDVYIYVRDNADELGTQNWAVDSDLAVYVGALCISTTLVPRQQNGVQTSANPLLVEALFQLPGPKCQYNGQHGGCYGNGNQN